MVILAIFSFLGIWVLMGNSEREPSWRISLVQATILWSAYLVLSTEILSWLHLINKLALSIVWFLPILVGTIWVWSRLKNRRILRLPVVYHRDTWIGFALDVILIVIVLTTAVVAFVSPPNDNDAMINGMSRVAHWAQNQSLDHYGTEIESQNSSGLGAEIIQLNLYVLSGSDQAVNMVAWIAYVGSIAAAASLADVLGTSLRGRRFAAIFGATLPAAITQATGSMNVIVVTFWVLSAILMLLYYIKKSQKSLILVLSALAAALAVLTSVMALIFLWPFALYAMVVLRQRVGMRRMLLLAVAALFILGLINGGTLMRNWLTYGNILNFEEIAGQVNSIRSRQLGGFAVPAFSASGEACGNLLHTVIFLLSFVVVMVSVVLGKDNPAILVYPALIIISLISFIFLFTVQPANSLLMLPFFFMFGPLVAFVLDKLEKYQAESILAAILIAVSFPWLFQTYERPIIVNSGRTIETSVFTRNRTDLYFASNPEDTAPYLAMTDEIKALGLTQIGLNLTDHSEEYPLWVMLGAPDENLRIEWVVADPISRIYLDPGFIPEAIICEDCSVQEIKIYNQDYQRHTFANFDLFLLAAD